MGGKLVYGFNVPESLGWTEFVSEVESSRLKIPFGWKKDPADKQDFRFAALASSDGPLEPLADDPIRKTDFESEMTSVRDQSFEGTCVGFSTAAHKEWQEKKERSTWGFSKTAVKIISPRYIYFKAREPYGWDNATDQGAYIRDAFKVINNYGAIIESGWPYQPEDWETAPDPRRLADSPRYRVTAYVRLDTVDQMARWLQNAGPFVAGVDVFRSFFYPSADGKIENPSNADYSYGGHAICMVGFDPDGFGLFNEPAFKLKNSWNTTWGVRGYGYISASYMENYSGDNWGSTDLLTVKPRV